MSFASCADLTQLESTLTAQIAAMAVQAATESLQGKVELATQLETAQGTDKTRAVTPYGLNYAVTAKIAEAMTSANITNLLEDGIGSDPGAQAAIAQAIADDVATQIAGDSALMSQIIASIPLSTEIDAGIIEIATTSETSLGIDDARAVTPFKLYSSMNDTSVAGGNQLQRATVTAVGKALASDSAAQTLIAEALVDDMALALSGDTGAMATIAAAIPNASTTVQGKVELATNTEGVAGTSTTLAMTPAATKAAVDAAITASTASFPAASTTTAGKVELATDAEAIAGTSTTLALTPANLAAVLAAMTDAFGS